MVHLSIPDTRDSHSGPHPILYGFHTKCDGGMTKQSLQPQIRSLRTPLADNLFHTYLTFSITVFTKPVER
jgi:hypothetical protein